MFNINPKIKFINELKSNTYADTIEFYTKLINIGVYTMVQIEDSTQNVVGLYFKDYEFFVPFTKSQTYTKLSKEFEIEKNDIVSKINEANIETQLSLKKDEDRINYTSRIKLETKFYNIFKNTMRNLVLNNLEAYDKIHALCYEMNKSVFYPTLLNKVKTVLETLGKQSVLFTKSNNLSDYSLLSRLESNKTLILPKYNLLNPSQENKQIYYTKLADELLRFKHISQLFFNKKQFILFQSLTNDPLITEILILESQLLYKNKEYLKNIKSIREDNKNPYQVKTTYNSITQFDKTAVSYTNLMKEQDENIKNTVSLNTEKCTDLPENISGSYLLKSQCFKNPSLYREINYGKHNECGLVLIVDLVFILFKQTITVTSIKYRLIEIYNSLMVTKDMAKISVKY